jgi:hypothetical protein
VQHTLGSAGIGKWIGFTQFEIFFKAHLGLLQSCKPGLKLTKNVRITGIQITFLKLCVHDVLLHNALLLRLFTWGVNLFRAQSNQFHPSKKLQKTSQLAYLHYCAVLVLATLFD